MNDQERKMLQEIIELSRDNNKMLRKVVRAQRWATFWRIFYWAIIIGSIVAGFYWVQPYISPFVAYWTKLVGLVNALPIK